MVDAADKTGEELVNTKIRVWSRKDKRHYEGVVESYDNLRTKKHKVLFIGDGSRKRMDLDNKQKGKWQPVQEFDLRVEGVLLSIYSAEPQKEKIRPIIESNKPEKVSRNKSVGDGGELVPENLVGKSEDGSTETPKSVGDGQEADPRKLVGRKVKFLWPEDKENHQGCVTSYDPLRNLYKVLYLNNETEELNLADDGEQYVLIEEYEPEVQESDLSSDSSEGSDPAESSSIDSE